MKKSKIVVAVAVAVLSVGGLSACGDSGFDSFQEQFKDAPIGDRVNEKVTIIEMPDGYANIATVCVNGVRYSSATVGGTDSQARAIQVTVDPSCND